MNRPTYQRKQAHRRRLALGRAMHQVRRLRTHSKTWHLDGIHVPKILRKHARLLRRTLVRG